MEVKAVIPRVRLGFTENGKGVPYGGSQLREDGSRNHGFKPVKGKPEEAAAIPEAQDNKSLQDALVALNDSGTAFFTIGCEKVFGENEQGFYGSGFIELAFNYCEEVSDAKSYFVLFFQFHEYLREHQVELPVRYEWELEGNDFIDGNCSGFSVVIWVVNAYRPTLEEAKESWGVAVDLLRDFLVQFGPQPGRPIY